MAKRALVADITGPGWLLSHRVLAFEGPLSGCVRMVWNGFSAFGRALQVVEALPGDNSERYQGASCWRSSI
jgi:hypothetical protein